MVKIMHPLSCNSKYTAISYNTYCKNQCKHNDLIRIEECGVNWRMENFRVYKRLLYFDKGIMNE